MYKTDVRQYEAMITTLVIAIVTVALFLVSVLFCPSVGKSRKIKIYPFIPLLGGILTVAFGDITVSDVVVSFTENTSVNPIKILVLFLSMTVYSLILDKTGFFGYISGVVLKHSGHSQIKVFLLLYAVISVLTIFTSNDIVILTFTPFICHFCRSAKIDVIPYLIMEFVTANTWSLFLLIGNPTNIYISGAFDISFNEYIVNMALPTIAAGLVSLGVMMILFGKKLGKPVNTIVHVQEINDKPLMTVALIHLIGCILLLAVSQYTGIEMWLLSFGVATSAVVCSLIILAVRKKKFTPLTDALKGMPFEIIPFVIGMFIIVLGLDRSGVTQFVANLLEGGNGVLVYGLASLFSSNLLNNIPMSVLFSKILASSSSLPEVFATIAGSNIGAFITPVGALAGIMWSNLIKQNKVKMSVGRFVVYGMTIGIPTMVASLVVIMLVV
jgi:arsenical pump membrane protein